MSLASTSARAPLDDLSRRLAGLRRARSLTLRQVAAGTMLNVGFLSQVERGLTNISVLNLKRLADFYGVSIRELFDDGQGTAYVTRAGERRNVVPDEPGVVVESLTPPGSVHLGAVLIRADSGAKDVPPYPHEADELTIVLSGSVRYRLGEEEYLLRAYDAIFHPRGAQHTWHNAAAGGGSVLLTVSSPATL